MIKRIVFIVYALIFSLTAMGQSESAPAFPGAEGHGRYTTGGRGGTIYHVTNLNDKGAGSFRDAVSAENRIVVFDVGGVIALASDVTIKKNVTILGQTAPYPGITLRYYTVRPGANNIIRFIRIRRGQEKDVNDGADAIWQREITKMIIDHCSFSWSIDEVASFYDNNNFTMQWCTLGESLCNPGHSKGAHGYGGIWGGKLASFHHNLICHVANRSPRFCGARYDWTDYTYNTEYATYNWENAVQAENVDFRNCVVYNANGCYGGPGGGQINMVGNYFKGGPGSSIDRITTVSIANSGNAGDNSKYWTMTSRYYLSDNVINGSAASWEKMKYDSDVPSLNGEYYTNDSHHYYGDDQTYTQIDGVDCLPVKLTAAAPYGNVTTHSAATAFNKVLAYAGASLCRDDVDERYTTEAANGTCTYKGSVTNKYGRIDLVSDVNGYTETTFGSSVRNDDFDTDGDGIPDVWEIANGLNPNSAADANAYTLDTEKGWYTNIEVYANSLVQDIMQDGNADATTAFTDYYPAVTFVDDIANMATYTEPSEEEETDITLVISQDTNTGINTSSTYNFNNGITITNGSSKAYGTGNEKGIKYSANVQYTINLPQNIKITTVNVSGYDNYADVDAYLGELNGVEYANDKYVFTQKDGDGNYTINSYSIELSTAAVGTLTFTPKGKQVVWVITLSGTKTSNSTPVNTIEVDSEPTSITYYDMFGQRVSAIHKGMLLKVTAYANGSTTTQKISVK